MKIKCKAFLSGVIKDVLLYNVDFQKGGLLQHKMRLIERY